jgi:hypothetical protein
MSHNRFEVLLQRLVSLTSFELKLKIDWQFFLRNKEPSVTSNTHKIFSVEIKRNKYIG